MATRIAVANLVDFPPGSVRVVSVAARDVAVFRVADEFYAIDDCCPHAGASLAGGQVEHGCVICPWHAWRFRLCDGAWADSPRVKTHTYPVQIADGIVYVLGPSAHEPVTPDPSAA